MRALIAALVVTAIAVVPLHRSAHAGLLDEGSDPVPLLRDLVAPLGDAGVDVLYSHASEAGQAGPSFASAPRAVPLLGFEAWPGVDVDMDRFAEWLDAFEHGFRGALAAVAGAHDAGDPPPSREEFADIWKDADDGQRVVITFDAADLAVAERVAGVLETNGYAVHLAVARPEGEKLDPTSLGRLFVQADHHITIDTVSARLNPIIAFEAKLLAELRRQRAWITAPDSGLPPVKRGSMDVVESLGALPMRILPGGIVMGMRPALDESVAGAAFAVDGSDYGIDVGDERFVLEQVSDETREAIRGFVANPASHSVVDIAGGRVTLADAFQDTRIGGRMEQADRMPFDHLNVRGAQKSLIVDQGVRVRREDDGVAVDVTLEVRFYRTDDDGKAERLASLRFTIEDALGSKRLLDLAWSRRAGHRIGFDGGGVEQLTDHLEQLALDAALISLARLAVPTA